MIRRYSQYPRPCLTQAVKLRIPEFCEKFKNFKFGPEKSLASPHLVQGKVSSVRVAGKGMMFVDVTQDFAKVQIVASNKTMGLRKQTFSQLSVKVGDYISCVGNPGVTNVGELSLKLTSPFQVNAPALQDLPPKLRDVAKINSNRVLDYLVNKGSVDTIVARTQLIRVVRRFLESRGFLEVSTPILAPLGSGASATPFHTCSQHIKDHEGKLVDLQLRVAPELWLKRLVIGGFDKVFEIGSVFRNEGIDSTHNPEFQTCEFYQSWIDMEDLMNLTETLFKEIASEFLLSTNTVTHSKSDFILGSEFQKIEFIPAVESATGIALPSDLSSDSLKAYFQKCNLRMPGNQSVSQFLDKLSSELIEPQCQSVPTFIFHQPAQLSPLSKCDTVYYGGRSYSVSKRFELFIEGKEYVNAYEEENSPHEQLRKFQLQAAEKMEHSDMEHVVPDLKYVEAMELGMPPTGGWGLGIDRLAMYFTSSQRIEQVLTFGKLTDVLKQ